MLNSVARNQSAFAGSAAFTPPAYAAMPPLIAQNQNVRASPQFRYNHSDSTDTKAASFFRLFSGNSGTQQNRAARRKRDSTPVNAPLPAFQQTLDMPADPPSDETQAIWRNVLAPSCRRPANGNAKCAANTLSPNKMDAAFLRELQKFFAEQRVAVNVRIAPAQALLELHRLVHTRSLPAAQSFHGSLLPQSDTVDNLVRHLSIAHFFYPKSAEDALRIDPAFASRLVGECLMALFADGPSANALQFNEFDFSKALRIAKPIAAVKEAFAMSLALRFGALPKNVREWAASMMLPHLHPSLARNDTPPHILYGSLAWADLAFGIDLIGNLGLDHGDYTYDQIAGLAKLVLAGAKFNDVVGKEAWRIVAPTALQFAHAQKRFDLGTHDIGNPKIIRNVIHFLDQARTAELDELNAAIKALGKQPRSREDIARAVLEQWGLQLDHRPGRSGWDIFLGKRFCEGDPTLLEAYLKDCVDFIQRACPTTRYRKFLYLDDETKAEWSAFDKHRAGSFAAILANEFQRSSGDYLRDWSGEDFVIYRPDLSQWITARGGQPINRMTDANIGIIVETRNDDGFPYFVVSANKDFLVRRINASNEADIREHVINNPHYYLSPDKLACEEPCVESRVTWMLLVTETVAPIQKTLDSRIGGAAHALVKHRYGESPETALLLDAAKQSKRRYMPFSICFKSGDARQLEQDLMACGLNLEESDLHVLRNRADSQYFREQTSEAVLTRDIKGGVLAAAAGRFAEQFPGAAAQPSNRRPTTMQSALNAMQNAGRAPGALSPGFRLMPQDPLRSDFLAPFMKMMESDPSTQQILQDLEKSWRYHLVYAPGIGWQADSAAAPNIAFAPNSGYQFKNIGSAKNVVVKNLQRRSRDGRRRPGIFIRVNLHTGGMFGPAMNLDRPAMTRPAALPSSFAPGAITDRPGYTGMRFTIAPSATVNRIMSSRLETRDIFDFNLNGRTYQVDMNAFAPRLRLHGDILADAQNAPLCRDERGAQKKETDSKNRCLTAESAELESEGIRFEQVYPGNDRRRDNYVQQEPVEGRICQLPRREQTVVFPQNQGDFQDLNVIIIDGILYQGANDKARKGGSPARSASAAQYKRLLEQARIGQGLPQIAPLPSAFSARLIDLGPDRRPMVEYVRESELRQPDAATNDITRISSRIRRDFFSRRSSPGNPAMGLIEVEEDIYYEFPLPPSRQGAPAEVWLTRVGDQALIDAFIQQATVADRMLSERFSVDIAPGQAATIIDIFRKCNMNDVLGKALQQEKMMRQLSSGNDAEIDDALLNYIDEEISDATESPPTPVLNQLEIALTAMMKSPERTAEFRRTLRERYQDQRLNVVFDEVYLPPQVAQGPDAPHISGAARALENEWEETRALFNGIYSELQLNAVSSAQEINAAFSRVFDSRNVAILVLETSGGEIFYLDSVSGTRAVPTRSPLAENDAHHVLVRGVPDANAPNSLPHLTNLLWNFEAQSREGDTERILFSWVLARFPQSDAIIRAKIISRLEICHSCVTCCISFAEHYKNATMEFSSFPRASGVAAVSSTTAAAGHIEDLK